MTARAQRIQVELIDEARMVARVGDFEIPIDLPEKLGGHDSAPTPTELFMVSIAACKLLYAYRFLTRRDVGTNGSTATISWESGKKAVEVARVEVEVPGGVDPKLRDGCLEMMAGCFVTSSIQSHMTIVPSIT